MQTCGIVAEYNPFHNGHLYHIAQTRRVLGDDCAIVCCLSGNYVQRGEAALLPMHVRAHMAVASGADLILALPAAYALRSAEGFAASAVALLDGLGCVRHLSFGCESPDLAPLQEIAAVLLEHRTVQDTLHLLQSGISYAAARERALFARIQEKATLIRHPNNILAIEYLKALLQQNSTMQPLGIPRFGAAHDDIVTGDGIASASHVRALLRDGQREAALSFVPPVVRTLFAQAERDGLVLRDRMLLFSLMRAQLLRLSVEDLAQLPDASEGLEHRLHRAIASCTDFDSLCAATKTKRYTLSRIRRMLYCAFLGLSRDDSRALPPYAHILAFSPRGRQVLHTARKTATLPLITKPAHIHRLPPRAQNLFSKEVLAADLYHLALGHEKPQAPGLLWRLGAEYLA